MKKVKTKIKLVHKNAVVPKRANFNDAGFDLVSPVEVIVRPHTYEKIDFGFQMEIPHGKCALIFARSGIGSNFGIRPRNCVGVIDSGYRGNVMAMMENHGEASFKINVGDRICQMVIIDIYDDELEVVDELDKENDRMGGFGSSGR